MKNMYIYLYFFVLISTQIFSQENLYSSITIPTDLKENANAVIRLNDLSINLQSTSKMIVVEKRIITILNKYGDKNIDAYIHYDKGTKVSKLQVLVFDKYGHQINKIKKKDFKDVSAVNGGTLYSDSRVKYLDYTPIEYPYTVEFSYETITENTAFIPSFYPLDSYSLSIEKSLYNLKNPTGLTIRNKELNFENYNLSKNNSDYNFSYEANNIGAIEPENLSPLLSKLVPKVMFSANNFKLEGVSGKVESWDDFGKWMYNDLINETQDLSQTTIVKVRDLVKNEKTDIKKAKKIYQFVQDKSRYISVQVGIGGWKPIQASQVDELGYGDCKGLTNYTMALLKAVGVASNYSVVFAGSSQKSLEQDFASMQGNHIILNIPQDDNNDIWLECTSQKLPFGFIGDFTDDRDVLVVSVDGGKIKHTKKYKTEENTQNIIGKANLHENGSLSVSLKTISKGIQYDNKYWLENETKRDLDLHYKKRWGYVNDIKVNTMHIDNDKENIVFKENIDFVSNNYANLSGERMIVVLNSSNRNTYIPKKYKNRRLPLIVKRGFIDVDEVEVQLPNAFKIEALPDNKKITNKFGSYTFKITKKDENVLIYKREFIINDGNFSKEDYKDYRNFYRKVTKIDNSKLVLIKK